MITSLRRSARSILKQAYSLAFYSPHWRVGWRKVDGLDLLDSGSLHGTSWRHLRNPEGAFLADPIAIEISGKTVVFMEEFHHAKQKGRISALEFGDDGPATPLMPVLEEEWHLSYPFVFECDEQIWMIPESSTRNEVVLYRADPFPWRWVREATLISGIMAHDTTLVRHEGRFWLFMTVGEEIRDCTDLWLFSSEHLLGPWEPHAGNPVLVDVAQARSAGPICVRNGRLYRPVQDCTRTYGGAVQIAEITALDRDVYRQEVRVRLEPCREWPGRRLHTWSRAGQFEFIDGAATVLRLSDQIPRTRKPGKRLP